MSGTVALPGAKSPGSTPDRSQDEAQQWRDRWILTIPIDGSTVVESGQVRTAYEGSLRRPQ